MDMVFHLTKCSETSMVASARIARFIAGTLGIPLVHTVDQLQWASETSAEFGLGKFILVNSPTGFADAAMREHCAIFAHLAEDAIFVQNDYKMRPPSQCKSVPLKMYGSHKGESSNYYGMRLWSTVPDIQGPNRVSYINWNTLTFSPPEKPVPFDDRIEGLVYWGALRKGREERLANLLNDLGDSVIISTAPQSIKKFEPYLPNARYMKPFKNLNSDLTNFKTTLYTQDEASDTLYCSPANRFYEAVAAGVAIIIDSKCVNTFEEAGLVGYEGFIARDSFDVEDMLDDAEAIAKQQRQLWFKPYKDALSERLFDLYLEGF